MKVEEMDSQELYDGLRRVKMSKKASEEFRALRHIYEQSGMWTQGQRATARKLYKRYRKKIEEVNAARERGRIGLAKDSGHITVNLEEMRRKRKEKLERLANDLGF